MDCNSSAFTDISKFVEFSDTKEYFGIIDYKHSIYRISLQCPEYPSMKNANVKIFKDLADFTFEFSESDEVNEFFNKFNVAVNVCHEGPVINETTLQRKRNDILTELTLLRSQHTYDIAVASDFTTIRFSDFTHYLTLSITKDLDVIPLEHSLPDQHKWFQSTGTVTSYLNEFTKSLEELDEFYSNLNAIDELCFVVDPLQPSTKNNFRIFKIDEKCFAKIVMDPLVPSSITVTFIGPTMRVEHYRNKYEGEISNWDDDLDVHKNLLKMCGLVYFPMRTSQDEDDMPSCSICGMFRLDDSIPMITCDNSKCDLLFHVGCLKQWWSMFADSKTFLYIELGTKCPMCKEKLSASFEQLLTDRDNY
ncbi:E3 ubiquitin-protein ligase FANCL isoform X1 [Bradysia coprophila]|uniref:E3 ubiquitin-protein ligase FANCL isoform X1 n=1 Tax=Bradysia coprophila TaxID=38358 RepID=UPI00187DD590|nr:E3 ubiquitin-protein ligase FANCL isoform X1 [Bradysia coprophila]